MILSFHPIIEADENLLCAGREPGDADVAAIKSAEAVILPQGCRKSLYDMARKHCRHVFPNYDCRFAYPGKTGQIALFQKVGAPCPDTETFASVATCWGRYGKSPRRVKWPFPVVFKFDWGGEGHGVHLIAAAGQLTALLDKAAAFERSGHSGFLLQQWVSTKGYALRVTVIGNTMMSYWRVSSDSNQFGTSAADGARIDPEAYPDLQASAKKAVHSFCARTGINLAGFDVLFDMENHRGVFSPTPLFLEINYFFGRRGIGGSETYYGLLRDETTNWLKARNLRFQAIV